MNAALRRLDNWFGAANTTRAVPSLPESSPTQAWKIRHAITGRARIHVPALHRAEGAACTVAARLASPATGLHVTANARTGTLLVRFSKENQLKALLERLEAETLDALSRQRSRAEASQSRLDQDETDWHLLDAQHALARLGSAGDVGLTEEEASRRQKLHGANLIPRHASTSGLSLFAAQFKSLPVGLLLVSASLSAATGGLSDALLILSVVGLNAGMGFVTESRSRRAIEALSKLDDDCAEVVRDGRRRIVPAGELVPGDVIALSPGSRVPADARVLKARDLTVDESALTGESLPVGKSMSRLVGSTFSLAQRRNMLFRGTVVTGGSAAALVTATGAETELGKIQQLVSRTQQPLTPLQRQLDELGRQLVIGTGAICGGLFVMGLLRRYGWLPMMKSSISLAVAAIPEGLPAVATTTFAVTVSKMRRRNLLIRDMSAVETLGAVEVLCFDKTGTLTHNRMAVTTVFRGTDTEPLRVDEGRFQREGGRTPVSAGDDPDLLRLLLVGALCNETSVRREGDEYVLSGSPTEEALVRLAIESGIDLPAVRERFPTRRTEYRTERRPYMRTEHGGENDATLVAVKGRPAEVLALCSHVLENGKLRPLTPELRESLRERNERLAADALRVLALAYRMPESKGQASPTDGLVWLGLVGMADPPRQGLKPLIERLHRAGIHTLMLTGDQAATAEAIGRALGMNGHSQPVSLPPGEISTAASEELGKRLASAHIVAGVTPTQKLRIVQALQANGRVVAMTGDGVNDGPALKAADIGIAMGQGTDVAREVGDVVLRDDNLETLVAALEQGRATYDNIRKSIRFIVSTNLGEVLLMVGSVGAGLGHPLSPVQLLWVNFVTDVFPALAIAVEPPESGVLDRPPRDPHAAILAREDYGSLGKEAAGIAMSSLAAYGYGRWRYGAGAQAGTLAFSQLAVGQLLHALHARSHPSGDKGEVSPYLPLAVGGGLALQTLALSLPGLRSLLGLAPISLADWLLVHGGALLHFFINRESRSSARRSERTGAVHSLKKKHTQEVVAWQQSVGT